MRGIFNHKYLYLYADLSVVIGIPLGVYIGSKVGEFIIMHGAFMLAYRVVWAAMDSDKEWE